jgi:hypothetical protein
MGPRSNIVEAIASKVGRNLHNKIDHPLQIIKTWITEHFCETYKNADGSGPLFECLDTLSPVVTTSMCFDDLLTAADHPSRSRSDTYYLDDHRLLRSHMTAHQTSLLREGRRSLLHAASFFAVVVQLHKCLRNSGLVACSSAQILGAQELLSTSFARAPPPCLCAVVSRSACAHRVAARRSCYSQRSRATAHTILEALGAGHSCTRVTYTGAMLWTHATTPASIRSPHNLPCYLRSKFAELLERIRDV